MSATIRPGTPRQTTRFPAASAPVAAAPARPVARVASRARPRRPLTLPGAAWLRHHGRSIARASSVAGTIVLGIAVLGALGWGGRVLWENRLPRLAPRHRPEALCFVLAEPPAFAPPMHVEPSVAVVRGRFTPNTPAGYAIRTAMDLQDLPVFRERRAQVGDYEVTTMWVRVPGREGAWLLAGWMEGSDLALCSFQFAADDGVPPEVVAWGDRLLARVLVARNFQAGALPSTGWRATPGATLPSFGPPLAGTPEP